MNLWVLSGQTVKCRGEEGGGVESRGLNLREVQNLFPGSVEVGGASVCFLKCIHVLIEDRHNVEGI